MRLFLSSLSSESSESNKYKERLMAVALNGDLSPTALDQLQIIGNGTLMLKDDTAYLVYTGNGQGDGSGDVDTIFIATKDMTQGEIYEGWTRNRGAPNNDAIQIVAPGSNVNDWDSRQILSRTAMYDEDEGIFKLWYIGTSEGSNPEYGYKVGYATSLDGINWTKYSDSTYIHYVDELPKFGAGGVILWSVYKESVGNWHAYACGERNADIYGGYYCHSTDGINWTTDTTPLFIGSDIRGVETLSKEGSEYILSTASGANLSQSGNYGGITTNFDYYKTSNLNTFTKIEQYLTKIEPQEAGAHCMNYIKYNGVYYQAYNPIKNQYKALNAAGYPEGFKCIRFVRSNYSPLETGVTERVVYPDYVLRYYPLNDGEDKDATQSPVERLTNVHANIDGVLSWNDRRYVQFNGTQQFIYPDYTTTLNDFSVKVNIEPYDTGVLLIAKQDSWELIQNNRKLEVKLYENAVLKKHYITTDDIVLPPNVWDEGTEVKVGFTFIGGILDLGFGDGLGKAVTKTVDDSMTNISLTGQVQIGELGETNSIRSLVFMTNPTEYQWLYEIDL